MMFTASAIPWLLDSSIPSIRYFTLTHLLDLPLDDPDVMQARQDIQCSGPVPVILARQSVNGNWVGERSYYTPKYTSTHWSMLLLAELMAGESDMGMGMLRGAQFMLADTCEEVERNHSHKEWGIECLWGNILRYVVECGFQDDPRTRTLIDHLVSSALEGGWRCSHNNHRPCAWGAARTLWGLAAIRNQERIPGIDQAIASGAHFLLEEHNLLAANYPTPADKISSLWFDLNFPLFYQADILFVLRMLGELKMLNHPGTRSAIEWLAGKRAANGHFSGSSPFRQRTFAVIGNPEETRRWVTLQATYVLKQAEKG